MLDPNELLRRLHMMPWASAANLEEALRVSRATVNRGLSNLYRDGLAVSRMVGHRLPATRRWISTSAGLPQEYAVDHGAAAHGAHGHTHDPLVPDYADHQHVPLWLGEAGIRELIQRMEPIEAFYQVAPCCSGVWVGTG